MKSIARGSSAACEHADLPGGSGCALISIGNSLRGDDGIALKLCNLLPSQLARDVCRFDLGPYTGLLADCVVGHSTVVIVDATANGTSPGTVCCIDLSEGLENLPILNIRSSHGFSILDELRFAELAGYMPNRVMFFGVESAETEECEDLSLELKEKLPMLVDQLSQLVKRLQETKVKHA